MATKIYQNGTYTVFFNPNSGRKEYHGTEFKAEFPDSLDIKLTNKCMKGCPFCHESSSPAGKHGDLKTLLEKLKGLPEGVELALGGGDALLHPDLIWFLDQVKDHFSVAMTVTLDDVKDWNDEVSGNNRIRALGISIGDRTADQLDIIRSTLFLPSSIHVYHVILGITPLETFKQMWSKLYSFEKILILGFKQFGRSKDKELPDLQKWKDFIKEIYSYDYSFSYDKILSFDNLALEQLGIREIVKENMWDCCYQGDEFSHSMYVDAVTGEYAPTSRTPYSERTSWDYGTIKDYFYDKHKTE